MTPVTYKPTKEEILAAKGKTVPDVIAPGLRVLFCGINPGLYSAAVGHNFARPGNRFWPTLNNAGFTPRLFSPFEERELLGLGYGITNVVDRATASAGELSAEELIAGAARLKAKVKDLKPACLAVLGISAYRTAFTQRHAEPGKQAELLNESMIWVLPNPSGLNAHFNLDRLARLFEEMRLAVPSIRIFPSEN